MPVLAEENVAPSRIREALCGWAGLGLHHTAGYVRRLVGAARETHDTNIAILCDAFLRYGSAQAIGLRQIGFNVTLYYVDRVDEFGGSVEDRALFLDRAQAAGVTLVPLPRRRMWLLPAHTLWLHRDLRRRRISTAVVQSHIDPRYATLGLVWPVALIVHDPQPHSGDTPSIYPLPVRVIPRVAELTSSCLIVHSARVFDQVRPLLRRLPLGVVPHGADMASLPAAVPKQRRLLIFGRLYEYKGVDTALEAFGALPDRLSDATLVVAGRGPLARLASNQRNVTLYEGYIADSDVERLLSDARLVLLPYKDATQSGVGLQAVAMGIPCVVSDAGGLPELLPSSAAGLVVPPNNPRAIVESIVAYIDHDDVLRAEIFEHALTNFSWPVVAQRLLAELCRLGVRVQGEVPLAASPIQAVADGSEEVVQ
jgi:glycosyltransferase involved in cell wall biosynthesis